MQFETELLIIMAVGLCAWVINLQKKNINASMNENTTIPYHK